MNYLEYLDKIVSVKIDREMGSKHPKHGFIYPVNYGYVPNTVSGDLEELDCYVLGIHEPIKEFTGRCIAIIHRLDDDDDKLVIVPDGDNFTNSEIEVLVKFQEKYFKHEIIRFNDDDLYIRNIIFKDNDMEYIELKKLHYKKEEVYKIKNSLDKKYPYVIEFTGTPRTGKTSIINNLYDFFKKCGFRVSILEEFTTSNRYKNEIYPLLENKNKNIEIPKYVRKDLLEEIKKDYDIILVDRSLFDRLIWIDRLYNNKEMKLLEYNNYKKEYIPIIKDMINLVIGTYTDSMSVLKRDYMAHLSLEKRKFLNEENVNEYNKAFINMKELAVKEKINFYFVDTTCNSIRNYSMNIANRILDDMKEYYLNIINK